MAVRSAMHPTGAAALTQLLQFAAPAAGQRPLACSCGHPAHYRELRSQALLTAVGIRPHDLENSRQHPSELFGNGAAD